MARADGQRDVSKDAARATTEDDVSKRRLIALFDGTSNKPESNTNWSACDVC